MPDKIHFLTIDLSETWEFWSSTVLVLHFASENADFIESSDYDEESVEITANIIRQELQLPNKNQNTIQYNSF